MVFNLNKYIIKKWIELRMSAQEFYFKEAFEINGEYPILKSILFFALFPIELIFIFIYARICGSLSAYTLWIICIMTILNLIISNVLINIVKDRPFIDETIAQYERLDYESRKKLYSFKNGVLVTFLMGLMPWLICIICISVMCIIFPH